LFAYRDLAAPGVFKVVITVLKVVYKLYILYRDIELRNILYDKNSGNIMVVDFERIEFRGRRPFGSIGYNRLNRKRKRGI
jgi:hypothetical protein